MASENSKTEFIHVRVTEKEKQILAEEADKLCLTMSNFHRMKLGLNYEQGYKV